MKPIIVCLTVFLTVTAVAGEEKRNLATPAKILFTGKGAGYFRVSGGVGHVTTIEIMLDRKMALLVRAPMTFKLDDAFKMLAVEGILTSTDNEILVKMAQLQSMRVPLLVADKVTLVDEKNKESFPAENHARIEAIARKVSIKLGSEMAEWAIQTSEAHIPLILPKDGKPPELGTRVRVSGKLRVVDAQVAVVVTQIEPVKK
jgi:hypothetical protein